MLTKFSAQKCLFLIFFEFQIEFPSFSHISPFSPVYYEQLSFIQYSICCVKVKKALGKGQNRFGWGEGIRQRREREMNVLCSPTKHASSSPQSFARRCLFCSIWQKKNFKRFFQSSVIFGPKSPKICQNFENIMAISHHVLL